jgi:CheY-like chemotaxis protein
MHLAVAGHSRILSIERERAQMSAAEAETRGKKLALVVDDEALIRMNICDMLADLGFEAVDAGNAEDGLELLERNPGIVLLVADIGLPGIGGEELVRRARDLRPQLRIVVATGHFADKYAGNAVFAGVSFLGKPFNVAALRAAVGSA